METWNVVEGEGPTDGLRRVLWDFMKRLDRMNESLRYPESFLVSPQMDQELRQAYLTRAAVLARHEFAYSNTMIFKGIPIKLDQTLTGRTVGIISDAYLNQPLGVS